MSVKSVYNFVPAPKESEVFKPDWANKVSHDIPFEDGESGEIEIEITANTSIFIRNGHTKRDAELFEKQRKGDLPNPSKEELKAIDRYLSFSNIDRGNGKEYFIPGSSLKGMFRNVLEIMSFSRLKTVNDIFSFRDLNHKDFKNEVAQNSNLRTGWLEKVGDNWIIKKCKVGRISIRDIEQKFSVSFNDRSAKDKYESINRTLLDYKFNEVKELGRPTKNGFIKTDILYDFSNNGSFKGDLVFFGSINNKKYEYIFVNPKEEKEYEVDSDLIKRFVDIDKKLENTQWQYLTSNKNPYPKNRIPIFFKEKNGVVEHFGFSRLYKMSNTKYLNELDPLKTYYSRDKEYNFDLADTIFGTVEDTDKNHGENRNKKSLKGRVYIGHSFAEGEVTPNSPVDIVMASPKASYYPFYLKDNVTYLHKNAELKGFKKYPVHSDNNTKPSNINEENTEIQTNITPLPTNTLFQSKIRFFNLKKTEIGALLSAITFHGNSDLLDHNLGSGKPLGFGKINIKIELNSDLNFELDDYLTAFEDVIVKELNNKNIDWIKSDALKELYAMAKDPLMEMLLKYPELEVKGAQRRDANEFNNFRKEGLDDYSKNENLKESFSSISERRKRELDSLEKEKKKQIENKGFYYTAIDLANVKLEQGDLEVALNLFKKAIEVDTTLDKTSCEQQIGLLEERIKENKGKYAEIIETADALFSQQKWQEAKDKYIEAIDLNQNEERPKIQKNACDKELERINLSLESLSKLSEFNSDSRKLIQSYFEANTESISDNDIREVKEFILRCAASLSGKKLKKFMNFKKDPWKFIINTCVDRQTAQNWHIEILK